MIIQYGNSQIITSFFNLIYEKKLILCYSEESRLELFRDLLIISHKHGAEQRKSRNKQDY